MVGGHAIGVVEEIGLDETMEKVEEGDEAGGDECLTREVALAPVDLLGGVGVESTLKFSLRDW